MVKPTLNLAVHRLATGVTEEDTLVVEEPLELRVGGRSLVVTMRTPGHDRELAAGFLYAEGLIDGPDDLAALEKVSDPADPKDNTVDVLLASGIRADEERFASARRALYASSACGVCGKATLEQVLQIAAPLQAPRRFDPAWLAELPAQLRQAQATFAATGGLHAAALFDAQGRLEVLREDIGRHNAVDKVLGWRLLQDRAPVDDAVLVISGRLGFEIVQKALVARVPAIVSVGAPSSLAIRLAREAGQQVVAFVRPGGGNVYSPEPT